MNLRHHSFVSKAAQLEFDHQLTEAHLTDTIIEESLATFEKLAGYPFPQDPLEQVRQAVAAVFGSWGTKRAVTYRELNEIPGAWGTAANIQAMVFGNLEQPLERV